MKRGTKVEVTFTGTLTARPTTGEAPSARIRVDGEKDWWAVVPASTVTEVKVEDPKDHHEFLRKFGERMEALKQDKHLREQVERLMPILTLIHGTKGVRTFEEYVDFAATMVARLELKPDLEWSGNYGGISAARGPMQGYALFVHATDVYAMHIGAGDFSGLDYWNEYEQHRLDQRQGA